VPSYDNPDYLKTGGPVKPPINQPKRDFRRKRSRSPSGDAALTRPKRTRRTKKGDTGATSQTLQFVDSPPVDGTDLNPPIPQPEVSGLPLQKHARRPQGNSNVPFSGYPPHVQDMMGNLATTIIESGLLQRHELEPCLGDALAAELMSFRPEANWLGYGEKGESILTLIVDMSEDGGFTCMWCGHRPDLPKWKRTVAHIREHHLSFRPFPCDKAHDAAWWVSTPLSSDFRSPIWPQHIELCIRGVSARPYHPDAEPGMLVLSSRELVCLAFVSRWEVRLTTPAVMQATLVLQT
jgi:hypothetical protein